MNRKNKTHWVYKVSNKSGNDNYNAALIVVFVNIEGLFLCTQIHFQDRNHPFIVGKHQEISGHYSTSRCVIFL